MPDRMTDKPHWVDKPLGSAFSVLLEGSPFARYGLSLTLVVLATVLAISAQRLASVPNVTLIYVIPVVVTASAFGWGPALLTVVLGAVAYDYFFTEPYYSLTMTDPAEIWALVLLLIVATIVASVAAQSRRRAVEAVEAAERAEALHALAQAVLRSHGQQDVMQAAAMALHRIFRAPTLIFSQKEGELELSAAAGGAQVNDADREAARGALSFNNRVRGESYPYVETYFDFWPIIVPVGHSYVLGVDFRHAARERSRDPDELIEGVAGYIASGPNRETGLS